MSNSDEETQICNACGQEKVLSLFPKWRLKCKACKSAENSARLKERYRNDPEFVEATKQRAANWQQDNAEKSNAYRRRRHAAKVAAGDREYLLKSSEATKRYYRSEKGRAATAAREGRYAVDGRDKAWRKARYARPENRTSMLVSGARNRALKANINFSLTFDDVYPAIVAGRCQKTGLPFDLSAHPKHRTHPFAPSIDRTDPKKGYTGDNIRVVCWAYNAARNQWGDEVLLKLAHAIVDANHLPDV